MLEVTGMVETEWFWLRRDPELLPIRNEQGLDRSNYPYFIDEAAFRALDDRVAFYAHQGVAALGDFLFEPTFMIGDRYQQLFHFLAPEMEFRGVQLYEEKKREKAPMPIFWLPWLPCLDGIHADTRLRQGKPVELILRREVLQGRRLVHLHLPAEDIWLASLEAAECILRRGPVGLRLEKIEKIR